MTGEAAEITSSTYGSGNAGAVSVQAGSLSMDDSETPNAAFLTGIVSNADPSLSSSTGAAGPVTVTVKGAMTMGGNSFIESETIADGNAGDITVHAQTLKMDGSEAPTDNTEIISESEGIDSCTGNSGKVTVWVTGGMTMLGNSDIDTDTETDGNAGEVTIHAGALTINGEGDPSTYTGISSDALNDNDDAASYNTGTAGSVSLTVNGKLIMLGNAQINTDTFTYGKAGDLTIHAGTMFMNGASEMDDFTAITSESDGIDSSTASSGKVTVTVDGLLTMLGNTEIDSDTSSCGNAGTVTIRANDLNINGAAADQDFTGISSDALDGNDDAAVNNTGNAGDVDVNVRDFLSIGGSGVIAAQTYTAGTGGDINVHAGAIDLEDSAAPQMLDGIGANAFAAGKGGQITIAAGNLAISTTAEIDSSSEISNAGDIIIKVANLSLTSGGEISTSAGNDGGSITINAGNLFYLDDGTIESSASGGATTKGGNITIDPVLLVLADGTISASDPDGSGGKISIVADNYFNQTMIITATGGVSNGAISISAPDLNLSGSLLLLPQQLESDENKLKESCVRSVNREFSSLVVVGRGGTELAPDELQPDFGVGR